MKNFEWNIFVDLPGDLSGFVGDMLQEEDMGKGKEKRDNVAKDDSIPLIVEHLEETNEDALESAKR